MRHLLFIPITLALLLSLTGAFAQDAAYPYRPVFRNVVIDASKTDLRRTSHAPIFVIHETTTSAEWVEAHVNQPSYRASFHAFIPRDGSIELMVPPDRTAWTAGLSEFHENPQVQELDPERKIKVTPKAAGNEWDPGDSGGHTVNNFAYQVELESPPDGYDKGPGDTQLTHSGYTEAQYQSLAWLAVKSGIPKTRITTHYQVDTTGHKTDPRSFDWARFWEYYEAVRDRSQEIFLGIEDPAARMGPRVIKPAPAQARPKSRKRSVSRHRVRTHSAGRHASTRRTTAKRRRTRHR